MKRYLYTLIFASLISASLCADTKKKRDPFWPVGYEPPPPSGENIPEPVIQEPDKPEPPPSVPVTSEDWKMARKLLKVNGYASGEKTDEGETKKTSVVIINLKHYTTNDKIKITHNNINFVWTVGPIENNSVELIETSAARAGAAINPP